MILKRLKDTWDKLSRKDINDNWTKIENNFNNVVDVVSNRAYEQVVDNVKLIWQEPVTTYTDLATTYPNAQEGWTAMAREVVNVVIDGVTIGVNKVYRFNGTEWKEIQQISADAVNEVDNRLTKQLAQVTLFVDDFKRLPPENNDTGRINRALDALKISGGELKFTSEYTVSGRLNYEFENDVRIILTATTNSIIRSTTLDYVLNISSGSNIGDVEIYNLNFDASAAGEHWDTGNRTQTITAIKCRTVTVQGCKIKNVYGTGIMCLDNLSVDVSKNILLDVRGYSYNHDAYGDGIYIGTNTKIATVKNNFIVNTLSATKRCGRIGIVLEFDVANVIVDGNYIYGYNRGIHDELTLGGHAIINNTIEACLVPYINVTPKGNATTLIDNNTFSTKDFIYHSDLRFKTSVLGFGAPPAGYSPKFKVINNTINQVNTANVLNVAGMLNVVASSADNVEFDKNTVICDITATGRNFNFGSRKNTKATRNKLVNIKTFTFWYSPDLIFEDNDVSCQNFALDRAVIKFNRNTIRPSDDVTNIGGIIYNRPTGQFNDNKIYDYSAATINNAHVGTNTEYIELSGNQFIKTKASTPALPLSRTTDVNWCDVFVSDRPNTVMDELNTANSQVLNFYGGTRYINGRRVIYIQAMPNAHTWDVGDRGVNVGANTDIKEWRCVVAGTPGVWRVDKFVEEVSA